MKNKLGQLSVLLMAGACTVSSFAQSHPKDEIDGLGITNTMPLCVTLEGKAVLEDGRRVRFGIGEDKFLPQSGVIAVAGAQELELTELSIYKSDDPKACENTKLIAEYEFKDSDFCSVEALGVSGGLVDADRYIHAVALEYLMLAKANEDEKFKLGSLSCRNTATSLHHEHLQDVSIEEEM